VNLKELNVEVPAGAQITEANLELDGRSLTAKHNQEGRRVKLVLEDPFVMQAGQSMKITLSWD
jgi:hypothetical protein